MDKAAPDPLLAIRNRIDAIDEEMHRLLVERSGVIAELIRVKGTSKPGAAFRPDREADMMRRIVMRHSGRLPLATVEHIWREIITTFTAMQAPFGVTTGPAADPLAMRDTARFYFGFSVPVASAASAEAAIAASAEGGDLSLIAAETEGRWWRSLIGARAPKIFARLPFLEIPDRPADLPAYVVGPPLKQALVPDIRLIALPDAAGLDAAVSAAGGEVAARAEGEALIGLPVAVPPTELHAADGSPLPEGEEVGGYCQPIRYMAERVA